MLFQNVTPVLLEQLAPAGNLRSDGGRIDRVRCLVRTAGVPLHEAVRMATLNPSAALRQETDRG